MSLKPLEFKPLEVLIGNPSMDLYKDIKRLDKASKICFTQVKKSEKQTIDHNVTLGYMSALARMTHEKANLVTIVLGVKQALEEYKKNK